MKERVLLVDDEKEFLEVMSERMANRGMVVSTAESAFDALEQLKSGNFDAIVLDLMMPGMDGIETLKNIKQKNPALQVILLTGHATVEKGIEAMKLGATDFVEKPADMNELAEKIKTAKANKMMIVEHEMEEKLRNIITSKGW
jgi:DNA-binding NtrC family response regulator